MSATLDTPAKLQVQSDLFNHDQYRRPPSMPVFRDEPVIEPMPKKPDPPKVMKPEKPLPWYAPERHPFLLEMLFKREARSMPREYEAGVSDEKKQRFKRGEA